MNIHHERLRTLYAVLAGIPAQKLDLESFYSGMNSIDPLFTDKGCGTNACAAGWAATYPEFVAQGLSAHPGSNTVKFFENGAIYTDFTAMAAFFGVDFGEASEIFGIKEADSQFTKGIKPMQCTDRRVALHRIRKYLQREKVITKARSKELMEQEILQEQEDRRKLQELKWW